LGRYAYALVRCQFDDGDYERFWEYVDGDAGWRAVQGLTANRPPAPTSDQPPPPEQVH